jgi:hypothetical protein
MQTHLSAPSMLKVKYNNPITNPSFRQRPFLDECLVRLVLVNVEVQILRRRKLDNEADFHVVMKGFLGDLTTTFRALPKRQESATKGGGVRRAYEDVRLAVLLARVFQVQERLVEALFVLGGRFRVELEGD